MPWWAICFTIVATETSTLTFIGVPAAAYAGNMTFLQLAVGYVIGRIIVSLLFIPALFPRRARHVVRAAAAAVRLGRQDRGGRAVPGDAVAGRWHPAVCDGAGDLDRHRRAGAGGRSSSLGVAMIVYTVRGGVAAVIWTDVVQMFVYVAGALVVFVALLRKIPGGWAEVVRLGMPAGKFTVIDLSLDPQRIYTLWAGVVGGVALTLATHGTDQFLVQRLLSARLAARGARGLVLSGFIVFAQFTLFLLIGAMLYRLSPARSARDAARAQRRDPAALHRRSPAARRHRLHRRGHRRRRAVAVDQRDGGDDGQRLLPEVRAAGRRTSRRCCGCRSAPRSSGASCSSAWRSARSGSISRCSTPACRCCR